MAAPVTPSILGRALREPGAVLLTRNSMAIARGMPEWSCTIGAENGDPMTDDPIPRPPHSRSSMGLRQSPITYLLLSNTLLWGLPLAVTHWQASQPGHEAQVVQLADQPSTAPAALQGEPMVSMAGPLQVSTLIRAGNGGGADVPMMQPEPSRPDITLLETRSSPDLWRQLRGADGLGGAITLESLNEPTIPIAARAEQLQWQRSRDVLASLPRHWREPLRREIGAGAQVSHAATVRLPIRDLVERQEVPVIITDQGEAEGLVKPLHPRTRQAVENWAARQRPAQVGTVQVIVVAAETMEAPSAPAGDVLASLPARGQCEQTMAACPLTPLAEHEP